MDCMKRREERRGGKKRKQKGLKMVMREACPKMAGLLAALINHPNCRQSTNNSLFNVLLR